MAVQLLDTGLPTPLERLVDDYLINCRARGLSPRTDEQYPTPCESVFSRGAPSEGITRLEELDRRAFDRYTSFAAPSATATATGVEALRPLASSGRCGCC